MKFVLKLVCAAAALVVVVPSFAARTVLDFEGVSGQAGIGAYYEGGTDGAGVAGRDLGVSFSGGAIAVLSGAPSPLFANAPTAGTAFIATDGSAMLNAAAGMVDSVSFFYSARGDAHDVVSIYSGLAGTGKVLGTVSLGDNAQIDGCTQAPLCHWQRLEVSFKGVGKSIGFGGNAGNVAFDNVAITAVPEPGAYAMLAAGLAGLAWVGRRRKA